jgi:hypothetical protein
MRANSPFAIGALLTRESGPVTQGELIRQEQEAGVVMTLHPQQTTDVTRENETGESHTSPPPDEIPHARGPSVVGVEDMGLQDGRGIEMSLASPDVAAADRNESEEPSTEDSAAQSKTSGGDADGDGDMILDNVTGREVHHGGTSGEIARGTESKDQEQEGQEQQQPSGTDTPAG